MIRIKLLQLIIIIYIINNLIKTSKNENFSNNKTISQILFNDNILELKYNFTKYKKNCKKKL